MSEQFLRVPLRLIRALRAAERTHCGITCVVLSEWERLINEPDGAPHTAGISEAEVATLTRLGVVADGRIMAVDEDAARLRAYRDKARIGGLKSSKRSSRRSSRRSSPVEPEDRRQNTEDTTTEEQSFSSVAFSVADATSKAPSLPVERENASPGVVALASMRELSDAMCEDFAQSRSGKYLWSRVDGIQLTRLRKAATDAEIRERWRRGLTAHGWQQVSTVAQLAAKWNDLAPSGLAGTGEIRAVEGSL